jgi:uroporphyrinogen decarboxylase
MSKAEPIKRKLVLDAIDHKETWRIPHMIQYHGNIGKALAAHYGVEEPEAILEDTVEWIGDRLTIDTLQELGILKDGEYTDEWGIRWHGVGVTRGQVKASPLREPTLKGYRFPDRLSPVALEQMKSQATRTAHKYRVAKLGALWEQATFVRGMADLLMDLILHPTFAHDLLEGITGYLLRNLELYHRELDVECIWLSDDYGSQSALLMSPKLWQKYIGPRVRRIGEAVHALGYHFALHSDGAISDIIPDVVEMGVELLHPVQGECVDVEWVKREFGSHLTLWGGYGSQGTLVFGTPVQVRQEVNKVCDLLGVGGGFILSPGLGLQDEVPLENAVAFIEVAEARERGR